MYTSAQTDNVFSITAMYTAFHESFKSDYTFAGEFHSFHEIVFVLSGRLGVTAGSDIFVLEEGQAIVHEPMEFHNLWSEGGTTPSVVVFSFGATNFPKYSSKLVRFSDTQKPLEILNLFRDSFEMRNDMFFTGIKNEGNPEYQLAVKALESFILSHIHQELPTDATLRTRSAQNFAKVVTVLEENLDKNLSVSDIARLCDQGEVSLKKNFSKYSGMGVITYFNKLKVTAAIQMLREGKTIKEISNALGFSDQNYFSTVFKRIMGSSPSQYK